MTTTISRLYFSTSSVRKILDGFVAGSRGPLWGAFCWDNSPQRHKFWEAIAMGEAPLCDRAKGFLRGLLYLAKNRHDVDVAACRRALDGDHAAIMAAFTWALVQRECGLPVGYWNHQRISGNSISEFAKAFLEGCAIGLPDSDDGTPKAPKAPEASEAPEASDASTPPPIPAIRPSIRPALTGPNVTRHYATGGGCGPSSYNVVTKLIEAREAEGYVLLGRASRSAALMHPDRPDEVLRIGRYDGKDATDGTDPVDGWLFYFDRMVSQTDEPYAPKVHKVDLFPDHYEVRMERLFEANGDNRRDLLVAQYGPSEDAKDKGFVAFLAKVREVWRTLEGFGVDGGLDLHNGNIMRRADGQIVLTDPFCLYS